MVKLFYTALILLAFNLSSQPVDEKEKGEKRGRIEKTEPVDAPPRKRTRQIGEQKPKPQQEEEEEKEGEQPAPQQKEEEEEEIELPPNLETLPDEVLQQIAFYYLARSIHWNKIDSIKNIDTYIKKRALPQTSKKFKAIITDNPSLLRMLQRQFVKDMPDKAKNDLKQAILDDDVETTEKLINAGINLESIQFEETLQITPTQSKLLKINPLMFALYKNTPSVFEVLKQNSNSAQKFVAALAVLVLGLEKLPNEELFYLLVSDLDSAAINKVTSRVKRHTALHLAVLRNRPTYVELLLSKGANPFLKDSEGISVMARVADVDIDAPVPQHDTLAKKHKIATLLKSHNYEDLLISSIQNKDIATIEELLKLDNLEVNASFRGLSALDLMTRAGLPQYLINRFVERGAKTNLEQEEASVQKELLNRKYDLAQKHMQNGQFILALATLKTARSNDIHLNNELNELKTSAYIKLATHFYDKGWFKAALQALRTADEKRYEVDKFRDKILIEQATIMFEKGGEELVKKTLIQVQLPVHEILRILGNVYFEIVKEKGTDERNFDHKTEQLFIESAKQGNVKAYYDLSLFYDYMDDYDKSVTYLKTAANLGSISAKLDLGEYHEARAEYKLVLTHVKDFADQGLRMAQTLAGRAYLGMKDYMRAEEYLTKAAAQRDKNAMLSLAMMYLERARDFKKENSFELALQYFEKAKEYYAKMSGFTDKVNEIEQEMKEIHEVKEMEE